MTAVALLLVAGSLGACASSAEVYGYPVYPHPENALPRTAIARLYGPIATIDGVDVSVGAGAFDVAPGCHAVVAVSVSSTPTTGRRSAGGRRLLPRFILAMKAGYTYRLQFGLTGMLTEESDPSGEPTGVTNPYLWRMDPDGTCAETLALASP